MSLARANLRMAVMLAAILLAACGATPPQAPLHYAKKLDSATSGISTACGLAYQVTAFPGDHRKDLITLNVTAASSAQKLALVYRRNPNWIYQGETVRKIVLDSATMLGSCGLHDARQTLLQSAAKR